MMIEPYTCQPSDGQLRTFPLRLEQDVPPMTLCRPSVPTSEEGAWRCKPEDESSQEHATDRAHEHADLGLSLKLGGIGERQQSDEQAHREADSAEQRDPVNLGP